MIGGELDDEDNEDEIDDGSSEASIEQLRRRGRLLSSSITALTAESQRLSDEIVQYQRRRSVDAEKEEPSGSSSLLKATSDPAALRSPYPTADNAGSVEPGKSAPSSQASSGHIGVPPSPDP